MADDLLEIEGIDNPTTLTCLARARTYKLYCQMVKDALAGRCPFCELDPDFNVVIAKNGYWRAWQSKFPEANTKHHFIMTPKRHVTDTMQLTEAEQLAFFDIMRQICAMHDLIGRGILIRDGDARLSAGTVEHLHAHLMVPNGTGRVESPFYKGAADEAKSLRRARIFEKMRQGLPPRELTPDEWDLVKERLE